MKIIDDVRAFHDACDIPSPNQPAFPSIDRVELRSSLVSEDYHELSRPNRSRFGWKLHLYEIYPNTGSPIEPALKTAEPRKRKAN